MVTTTTATGQPSATAGRNVLDELDKRVPTSFIWSLTLLATLGRCDRVSLSGAGRATDRAVWQSCRCRRDNRRLP